MATPERRASELLRQALRQLKKGEADQGEQALRQRVQEYLANPPDPGTLAEAHNELGIFYTLTNRDADAVECYICACAVPPADAAGRRDRAKYLLHLGNALEELGRGLRLDRPTGSNGKPERQGPPRVSQSRHRSFPPAMRAWRTRNEEKAPSLATAQSYVG